MLAVAELLLLERVEEVLDIGPPGWMDMEPLDVDIAPPGWTETVVVVVGIHVVSVTVDDGVRKPVTEKDWAAATGRRAASTERMVMAGLLDGEMCVVVGQGCPRMTTQWQIDTRLNEGSRTWSSVREVSWPGSLCVHI